VSGFFITGAGTEIGKTFVTCALIHQLRRDGHTVRALKPVISGYDPKNPGESDSGKILMALGETATDGRVATISPWRYLTPMAPNMAARREGHPVHLEELVAFCRDALRAADTVTLIEGVGGVMAPITDDETVLDWMTALACPALLVTGSYLGAISHTLTAVTTLETRGIPLAGVVLSESADSSVPLDETVSVIARLLPKCTILVVPRLASFADAPDLTRLLQD
jgi:dethiobiotin synthetase